MRGLYLLNSNGVPYQVHDFDVWARGLKEDRRVARTDIDTLATVSTVFLGIDHNFTGEGDPILFETMVFFSDDGIDEVCERYSFWPEAVAGHKRLVDLFTVRVSEAKDATAATLRDALHSMKS